MNPVILLLATLIIPSFVASSDENPTLPPSTGIVKLDIYYEALCPDSQKFFNQQFTPNIHLLVDNAVNVDLIPYGKMTHDFDESTGQWKSVCRHSESECEGHRIHACALHSIPKVLDRFEYISCLMKRGQKNKPYPGKECADHLKSSHQIDYNSIAQCASSLSADDLIEVYKTATLSLQPPLKSVPVVVFNGLSDQENTDLAEKNFKATLCKYLSENHQDVGACSSISSAEGHEVTLTLLLSAVTVLLMAYRVF